MSVTVETGRSPAELVQAAQQDQGAFEELVDRYESLVWRVVRDMRLADADAHDAVQCTWLRLFENLDRLRDPEHVGSWLATTARRECLRLLRSGRREVDAEQWLQQRPDAAPSPEQHAVDGAMAGLLWQQVAALPGRGQALVRALTATDAPAYAELASSIGMPIGSIGPTRGRYLRRLRDRLEGAGLGAEAWV